MSVGFEGFRCVPVSELTADRNDGNAEMVSDPHKSGTAGNDSSVQLLKVAGAMPTALQTLDGDSPDLLHIFINFSLNIF